MLVVHGVALRVLLLSQFFWMLGVFPPLVENIKNYVFAIVISRCTMGHGISLKKGRAIELYIHMDKAMATYGGMET